MHAKLAPLAALTVLLAGCVTPPAEDPVDPAAATTPGLTSVHVRASLPFNTTGAYSFTLQPGLYSILDPISQLVDVELPIDELGSAVDGSAKVHMGLWLPDVPEGTKVPVIADIGPYYSDGDVDATTPALRLGKFLIENFVPHGYAVAQVSVFGTGDSTHCMDLMGRAEQLGIDAAVTWLGTQDWSNGNVGLIGRSYDGSTPWEAATFGNDHLKTIVPISGLTGAYELMWRNGTAEFRGPIMHNGVYGLFGIDSVKANPGALQEDPTGVVKVTPDAGDAYTACTDYVTGPANGVAGYAGAYTPYWEERYFLDRALANYKGSVYFIHGLQDWNVDPHMAFPAYQMLEEAGIETKGLFGQWAHMYPDRAAEHENLPEGRGKEAYPASVRMDWAQDLLEWFEHYLKGTGPKPPLHAEVQDNLGGWRVEATYPPLDAAWTEITLADAKSKTGDGQVFNPGLLINAPTGIEVSYTFDALSATEDVRIAGLPQFHVTVTPTGPGGQLFAMLTDAETGMHLGHAVMDLRFAAGGNAMRPVVPGQALVAYMEFEPLDIVLPAGHGLKLTLASTGEDYLPAIVSAPVRIDESDASVLRLPVVTRAPEAFFVPPAPTAVEGDTPEF